MALDLTLIVVDIIISLILFIVGLVVVKQVSNWAGYKLTLFKLEKLPKKEKLKQLKEQQEKLKSQERFAK